MAVTASGLYFLTIEKMFLDTLGQTWEDELNQADLVTDTEAPNFDTHDFHADLLAIVSGGNYAQEVIVGSEITTSSGTLTYDHTDSLYDNAGANDVTITNAMAQVASTSVGASATDQLMYLLDFVTAASCSNSTFTVQIHTSGVFTWDFTPP